MARDTLERIPIERPEPTKREPQGWCLDKGYDYDEVRDLAVPVLNAPPVHRVPLVHGSVAGRLLVSENRAPVVGGGYPHDLLAKSPPDGAHGRSELGQKLVLFMVSAEHASARDAKSDVGCAEVKKRWNVAFGERDVRASENRFVRMGHVDLVGNVPDYTRDTAKRIALLWRNRGMCRCATATATSTRRSACGCSQLK
jgi:hypothetical protein